MTALPITGNEQKGIQAIKEPAAVRNSYSKDLHNLAAIAAAVCNMPFSAITIFGPEAQKVIGSAGFENETNLHLFFPVKHTLYNGMMQACDTAVHADCAGKPFAATDPAILFYTATPLLTAQGSLTGTLIVMHTQSYELTAEQQSLLQSLAAQVTRLFELEKSNTANDALLKKMEHITLKVAHDIRNPLGALKNIIELFHTKMIGEEEAEEMIPALINETDRIISLTSNIGNWGSLLMHSGNAFPDNKEHQLSFIVNEQCRRFKEKYAAKNNIIINSIDESLIVSADGNMLNFILENLLSNACKFTTNGIITISSVQKDTGKFLKVTDTGVGIPARQMEKINAGKDLVAIKGTNKESGSALGLLLIKQLQEQNNKTFSIQSEMGIGTEVLVEL